MITIDKVSKRVGSTDILKNITLNIHAGDIYGIIGESGAGKSTLLRCINGLETYQEGTILVANQVISTASKRELRHMQKNMGMIFQHFHLLQRCNVYDNVALPLQFWRQNKNSPANQKKIIDLLKLVGLYDKKDAYPNQLSGGQKQRVAIARALVLDPQIVLCDEATSALDPRMTKDILSLLSKINRELNITIVMVTHQMEVVKEVCNKVALMRQGEIIAQGKPEDIFLKPHPKLQSFVDDHVAYLPKEGDNIKIFFTDQNANSYIITELARTLQIHFSICQGKLENYRGMMMGSLIINVQKKDTSKITQYLQDKQMIWEVV